jgi:hypothetical protein
MTKYEIPSGVMARLDRATQRRRVNAANESFFDWMARVRGP